MAGEAAGLHRAPRVRPARPSDLDALLGEGLDAVYVCVPPFAHGPVEQAIAAAGLAMFVEKPLGLDESMAAAVADAVAAERRAAELYPQ